MKVGSKIAIGLTTLMAAFISMPLTASAKGLDYTKTPNQYVEAKGTRYAYRTIGNANGKLPLVLFHHFTGTMDDWDSSLINGLAKSRKLYIFDNAGVGASGGTTPDTISAMSQNAQDFIDALKLKKIDALGFSMGGFIVQQILLERPDLVGKAILTGTAPQGGDDLKNIQAVSQAAFAKAAQEKVDPRVYLFFPETKGAHAAAFEYLTRVNNHTVDIERPTSQESSNAQLAAILTWASSPNVFARLETIKQPILIVNGSNDILLRTPNSFLLYQHLPNSYLSLYPDSGHAALFQYHELFVSQVNTFLDGAK